MQVNWFGAGGPAARRALLNVPLLNGTTASPLAQGLRAERERVEAFEDRLREQTVQHGPVAAQAPVNPVREAWRAERNARQGEDGRRTPARGAQLSSATATNPAGDSAPDARHRAGPEARVSPRANEAAPPESSPAKPAERAARNADAATATQPRRQAAGAANQHNAQQVTMTPGAMPPGAQPAPAARIAAAFAPKVTSIGGVNRISASGAPPASGAPEPNLTRPRLATAPRTHSTDPAATPRNADANFERILRFVHLNAGKQRSEAILRLDPPELGKIRLQMNLQRDELELRIEPQSELARKLLSENADALRGGLEAAGLRLVRMDVQPAPPPESGSPGFDFGAGHGAQDGAEEQAFGPGSGFRDEAATMTSGEGMEPAAGVARWSGALDLVA